MHLAGGSDQTNGLAACFVVCPPGILATGRREFHIASDDSVRHVTDAADIGRQVHHWLDSVEWLKSIKSALRLVSHINILNSF